MGRDKKHISEEEKKKGVIIFVLIGILIAIAFIIILICIPKGEKHSASVASNPPVGSKPVVQDEPAVTNESSNTSKNTTSNKNSNKVSSGDGLDIIAKDKNKVTMEIKAGTLTVDGAVIVITDTNISPYTWTPIYKLQQKIDGEWQDMELQNPENAFFAEIQYDNSNGLMEQSLVWSNKYGRLGTGEYRIVKEASGIEFYAVFQVQ